MDPVEAAIRKQVAKAPERTRAFRSIREVIVSRVQARPGDGWGTGPAAAAIVIPKTVSEASSEADLSRIPGRPLPRYMKFLEHHYDQLVYRATMRTLAGHGRATGRDAFQARPALWGPTRGRPKGREGHQGLTVKRVPDGEASSRS